MMKAKKILVICAILLLSTVSNEALAAENSTGYSEVTYFTPSARQTGPVDVGFYQSWTFYGRSAPEPVRLYVDANSLSLVGYCEGEEVDNLTCYITSMSGGSFNQAIPFDADGSVYTYPFFVPTGEYKIFFSGLNTIKKTDALCIFTQNN